MEEAQASECSLSYQTMNNEKLYSPNCELDVSQNNRGSAKHKYTNKRARIESCGGQWTKACREKMRRDRLNQRFMELHSMLGPGSSQNSNKVAILSCATHLLNQLRLEEKKLEDKNKSLQMIISSLKDKKMELWEEKSMLRAEKERMEQILKNMSTPFSLAPHFAFYANANSKPLVHSLSYMPQICQWISPVSLDTSQDHVLWPPVA